MKLTCILLIPNAHRLTPSARKIFSCYFNILEEVNHLEVGDEDRLAKLNPDWVFSFLSPLILRGKLLEVPNINFHPAPPEHPGRGAASYALFYGDETFGATAHRMIREVDAGEIYRTKRFSIDANDNCASVFETAEDLCLELAEECCRDIGSASLKSNGETWKRKATKRKDFEKWMILDPSNHETFEKKIRATRHPKYKGPYVYIHGHRFCLDPDDQTVRSQIQNPLLDSLKIEIGTTHLIHKN